MIELRLECFRLAVLAVTGSAMLLEENAGIKVLWGILPYH